MPASNVDQWKVFLQLMAGAPLETCLMLAAFTGAVWWLVHWGFSRQVTNLKEQVQALEQRRQLAEDRTKAVSDRLEEATVAITKLEGQITGHSEVRELTKAAEDVRLYVRAGKEANTEVRASLSS